MPLATALVLWTCAAVAVRGQSTEQRIAQAARLLRSQDGTTISSGADVFMQAFDDPGVRGDARLVSLAKDTLLAIGRTSSSRTARSLVLGLLTRLGPDSQNGYLASPLELFNLYGNGHPGTDLMVLHRLGGHPQQAAAATILASVASDPATRDVAAVNAIDALVRAGEPGRRALQELFSSKTVRSRDAQARLNVLAKTGFRAGGV